MIIIGSLTVVSLTKLEKQNLLIGFLLIEGLLTNLGGLLTLISSVPNIIVGGTAGISFIAFFLKAAPYVLVVTVVTIYLGAKLFAIKSLTAEEKATAAPACLRFRRGRPHRKPPLFLVLDRALSGLHFDHRHHFGPAGDP